MVQIPLLIDNENMASTAHYNIYMIELIYVVMCCYSGNGSIWLTEHSRQNHVTFWKIADFAWAGLSDNRNRCFGRAQCVPLDP
jgi:hypothetical protein